MQKVAVVTDSTATVPDDLLQELNIRVVPVLLLFGQQAYRDGVDIRPKEVYRLLRSGSRIPSSAAPSVGDFLRVYAGAAQEATGILSVHMSPKLSATFSVARMAGRLVDGTTVRVFDCQTAAMGQGFVVLAAARAAARGAGLDEVLHRAEEIAAKVNMFFTLDTFEYLHRGGRIGGAAALMGSVLQIRPVLYLADGHVAVFRRPRTKRRALRTILQQIEAEASAGPLHAAVLHADTPDEAEELRNTIAQRFDCAELHVAEFTPVMGAHTGPGLVGVAFYAE
jgi:DegV family protein with EDD domain